MVSEARQLSLPFDNKPLYHADDFVVAANNINAYRLVTSWPDWGFASACIIAPKGAGKTHLARIWQARSQAKSVQPDELKGAVKAVAEGQNILLEDLAAGTFVEDDLFHLLNAVMQSRIVYPSVSLLITTQTTPTVWPLVLKDLISRLHVLPKIYIEPPELDLLHVVLSKLFSDMQIWIEPKLVNHIVSRMERSIDFAIDFAKLCNARALAKNSKVTKSIADATLNELMESLGRRV